MRLVAELQPQRDHGNNEKVYSPARKLQGAGKQAINVLQKKRPYIGLETNATDGPTQQSSLHTRG